MSDESSPNSPSEIGKPGSENKSIENAAVDGSDAEISGDSQPPAPEDHPFAAGEGSPSEGSPGEGPLMGGEDEDDFEIIFYATIDTPQGEQIITPDALPQDEIKILLPAWSESTTHERTPAAPPIQTKAAQQTAAQKQSIWRGCFIGAIAAIIVLSLLGSSLFSLYWFWDMRNDRMSEVTALLDEQSGQQEGESENGNRPPYDHSGERDQTLAPALAAVPTDPVNRIVFINDNRQIETISPDGSDQRKLTSDAKSYLFPAWSQDGRSIASIGTTINGAGIYVMPDEEETAEIEEVHFSEIESPFYLYWSPDGQQITYLANDHPIGLSLNIVDLDGSSASRTIAVGNPMYWNWTADSQEILVHSGSDTNDSQLIMIDDYGRPVAPQISSPGPFQAPGISPSGRYWAYSQFQSGGTTWLVIDDRQTGTENSQRHAGSVAFNWSPAGDELAFISGDAQDAFSSWGPLRLMDAGTGDIRLLSSNKVLAFFWSPDGRKIATISVPDEGILGEQFEVRNEKGRRLARFAPGSSRTPAAQMPLHTFHINVIDIESGEGLQLLETSLSPIFLTQFLPYFDQYAFSHQIWSPDSNSLILPLGHGQHSNITLIDARNGQTTNLAGGSIGFWSRQ